MKDNRLRGRILTLVLTMYCTSVLAVEVPTLTSLNVLQAVELALKQHPSVKAAEQSLVAMKARMKQAEAPYYPQLALSPAYVRADNFQPQFAKRFDYYAYSGSAVLSQNVYDFGRTAGQVAAARGAVQSLIQDYSLSRQALVLRVKSAYWGLLAARRIHEASQETVQARAALLKQASEFFGQGLRPKFDLTQAQADLTGAQADLIKAGNDVAVAWEELQNSLGLDLTPGTTLQDDLEVPAVLHHG